MLQDVHVFFLRPTDNGYTPLQKHQGNACNSFFNRLQRTLHQTVLIKARGTNCQWRKNPEAAITFRFKQKRI